MRRAQPHRCPSKILGWGGWAFLGCVAISVTFRPGHFFLQEGEDPPIRSWGRCCQSKPSVGLGPHFPRSVQPGLCAFGHP